MNNFTSIVMVKQGGRNYLFEAPMWSGLKAGDNVLCDTRFGENMPGVCASDAVMVSNDILAAIVVGMGATIPLRRVTGLVTIREFEYKTVGGEQSA